jgi:GNAT superfamily N-acetyltransferase
MSTDSSTPIIRPARISDRNHLRAMQVDSMRRLAIQCYSRAEVEAFIVYVGTMDDQLIDEGTYYLVEVAGRPVASGGWSRMRGNYIGTPPVDPTAAKIRSVFVHHEWARHGFGRMLMARAEQEAFGAGFDQVELNALLSGVPFYRALGYDAVRPIALGLPDGITFRGLTMMKPLGMDAPSARADTAMAPGLAPVPAALAGCVDLACRVCAA